MTKRKVRVKVFKTLCETDILVPSAPFSFTLEADDNYFLTLLDQDTERNTK